MHKAEISNSANSTEENQTPEPLYQQFMFPKIRTNQFKDKGYFPQVSSSQCNSPMFTTVVPQLDYLKYRDHHFSKHHAHSPRFQSDSPSFNYFYQPQVIQISPRSKVKVFSCFPIAREENQSNIKRKISKAKHSKNLSTQPRVLPQIAQRLLTCPEIDMKPALTYGEKLWKLNELAALDKKT